MQDALPRILKTHAWLIDQALTAQAEGQHDTATRLMGQAAAHITHIGRALDIDLSDGVKM